MAGRWMAQLIDVSVGESDISERAREEPGPARQHPARYPPAVATPKAYRPLFALGAGIFFASTATGLGYALVSEREIPMVEIEERLPSSLDDHRGYAAIKPRNPIALILLGDALAGAGELAEAVRVFEQALAGRAAPVGVHERLARLYLRQGRLEMARRQARATYRKGGSLDPRLMKALNMSEQPR